MKKLLVAALAVALVAGCSEEQKKKMQSDWDSMFGGEKAGASKETGDADKTAGAESQPASVASQKGNCLKVFVDDVEAVPGDPIDGTPHWKAAMSTKPKIRYEIVENQLGKVRSTEILLYPVVNGKKDLFDVWQPVIAVDLKPGESRQFTKFMRIKNAQTQPAAETLPAGNYIMAVKVEDTAGLSDTQSIVVEIK